jgi:hypothetical protein
VFEPRAGDKQEDKHDHETLLGLDKNEKIEETFHRGT